MIKKILICLISCFAFAQSALAEWLLDPMPATMAAQNFSLPSVTGKEQTLKQYKGSYVLVNFWSAECQICVAELSVLQDLYNLLQPDYNFEIIAIHAGANLSEVNRLPQNQPRKLLRING